MSDRPIVIVSGGFDPLHSGHLNHLEAAAKLGDVVVGLNSDEWLVRKKGRLLLSYKERKRLLLSLPWVRCVVAFGDRDGSAKDLLKIVHDGFHFTDEQYPRRDAVRVFAKGGDRTMENIPEVETCRELGIIMAFNVGGDNGVHSSDILKRWEDGRKASSPS